MSAWEVFSWFVVGLIVVYIVARLVFAAFFRAKAAYMKEFFRGNISKENDSSGS